MLADWGVDSTHSIAAKLAAIPVDVGVTRPSAPTLYDETRSPEASVGLIPKTVIGGASAVLYSTTGGMQLPMPTNCYPDFEMDTLIRAAVSNSSADKNARDSALILLALIDNLNAFNLAVPNTVRTRNRTHIVSITAMRWLDLEQKIGDPQAPSGLLVTSRVRINPPS